MDSEFIYKLSYTQDADSSLDASDMGLSEGDPTQSSRETFIFPGVTPNEHRLFFPHAFYSRLQHEEELGVAEGEPEISEGAVGEVQYHPGYLTLYPVYAVCTLVPRRPTGTGVFHPLRSFASRDGTTVWQTQPVHESQVTLATMYVTDEVVYTVERYVSVCANLFRQNVLPWEEIQRNLGVIGEYPGDTTATTGLTTPDHTRPVGSSETHKGATTARTVGIDQEGSSSSNSGRQDNSSGSNLPSSSDQHEQVSESYIRAPNTADPKIRKLESEADNVRATAATSSSTAAHHILSSGSSETHSASEVTSALSLSFDEEESTSSTRNGQDQASGSILPSDIDQHDPVSASDLSDSTSMNSCESAERQVLVKKALDLDTKRLPTDHFSSSLEQKITTSPPLRNTENNCSDISAEVALTQPGSEPESRSGDAFQNLRHTEETARNLETIRTQKRVEESIAYKDPYRIQQHKEEKHEVKVEDFKEDYLDEELWPALPTLAPVVPVGKLKQKPKKDSILQPSSSSS